MFLKSRKHFSISFEGFAVRTSYLLSVDVIKFVRCPDCAHVSIDDYAKDGGPVEV